MLCRYSSSCGINLVLGLPWVSEILIIQIIFLHHIHSVCVCVSVCVVHVCLWGGGSQIICINYIVAIIIYLAIPPC